MGQVQPLKRTKSRVGGFDSRGQWDGQMDQWNVSTKKIKTLYTIISI